MYFAHEHPVVVAVRREALEEAAKICDKAARHYKKESKKVLYGYHEHDSLAVEARHLAAEIRKLKRS